MWLAFVLLLALASPAWAGQLDASWSAPTTFVDGSPLTNPSSLTYRVYWQLFPQTPCPGTQFIVTSPGQTAINLPGLTQGMTYNAQVTANNSAGEGACSLIASGPARADTAPVLTPGSNLRIVFVGQAPPIGTTVDFGNTTVETPSVTSLGGVLDAQPATLSAAGTLQSLAVYVATPSGRMTLGIYDATGANGGPGRLLSQTQAIAPVAGWNIAPTTTTPAVAAGSYWLALTVDSNGMALRRAAAGSGRRAFSFTLTTPFPTGSATTQRYSLYGTVTVP